MEYKVAELSGHRDCARFTEEGMEGVKRKNPDIPVSLMSISARQAVDQAELRGLCYERFRADITIECDEMPAKGAIIQAKELTLRIMPQGKRCWPECKLFQEKLPCPLREGVRYAQVDKTGDLCKGEVFREME
jgi:hypothetical protein